jgi:hypothetical protein
MSKAVKAKEASMSKVIVIDLVGESESEAERKAAPENIRRELLEAPAERLQEAVFDGPSSGTQDAYRALLVRYLFRR